MDTVNMPPVSAIDGRLPFVVSAPAATAPVTPDVRTVEQMQDQLDQATQLLQDADHKSLDGGVDLSANFLLSIVIPVYNEQQTIEALLRAVASISLPKEIIVIDDCSRDQTPNILRRLQPELNLRLITKTTNEGKGAALHSGFAAAQGDVVVVQDADLEYDPADIPELLRPIAEGRADVVYGSRFLGETPQDPSATHRFGNRLLTAASNLFTGLHLTDMETCYKAFRRSVLDEFQLDQKRFGFEPEITAKLARRGCRFAEVPVRYHARSYKEGKKIGVKDGFNALYCIVRYGLWK